MKTYKITVRPETKDLSLILLKQSTKNFVTKKEALKYAKHLISLGWEIINYNVDTYENGFCIKNEFSKYDGKIMSTYSVINYKKPKLSKITKSDIEQAKKDYFNL